MKFAKNIRYLIYNSIFLDQINSEILQYYKNKTRIKYHLAYSTICILLHTYFLHFNSIELVAYQLLRYKMNGLGRVETNLLTFPTNTFAFMYACSLLWMLLQSNVRNTRALVSWKQNPETVMSLSFLMPYLHPYLIKYLLLFRNNRSRTSVLKYIHKNMRVFLTPGFRLIRTCTVYTALEIEMPCKFR